MPFNAAVFKVRALSAIAFVAIMLAGIFYSAWSFTLLFALVHAGCWWEYIKLQQLIHKATVHPYLQMGCLVLGFGIVAALGGVGKAIGLAGGLLHLPTLLVMAGTLLCLLGLLVSILKKFTLPMPLLGWLALGWLYISVPWGLMLWMYQAGSHTIIGNTGWLYPMLIIASIWINDTMAYLVGSFIGKTPLSPISPKKTWEGTIGGIVLAVALVSGLGWAIWQLPPAPLVGISLTAAITGTLGDLFESKLKRRAGVKDSGQILPGHGGFLDRFDSLLFATPAVWLILLLMGYL